MVFSFTASALLFLFPSFQQLSSAHLGPTAEYDDSLFYNDTDRAYLLKAAGIRDITSRFHLSSSCMDVSKDISHMDGYRFDNVRIVVLTNNPSYRSVMDLICLLREQTLLFHVWESRDEMLCHTFELLRLRKMSASTVFVHVTTDRGRRPICHPTVFGVLSPTIQLRIPLLNNKGPSSLEVHTASRGGRMVFQIRAGAWNFKSASRMYANHMIAIHTSIVVATRAYRENNYVTGPMRKLAFDPETFDGEVMESLRLLYQRKTANKTEISYILITSCIPALLFAFLVTTLIFINPRPTDEEQFVFKSMIEEPTNGEGSVATALDESKGATGTKEDEKAKNSKEATTTAAKPKASAESTSKKEMTASEKKPNPQSKSMSQKAPGALNKVRSSSEKKSQQNNNSVQSHRLDDPN